MSSRHNQEREGPAADPQAAEPGEEQDTRGVLLEFVQSGVQQLLPHVSVDCAIFGFHDQELKILLLKWRGVERWCLPGGYVRRGESLDDAAAHVLRERTGLTQIYLQQFRTFGGPNRGEDTLRTIFELQGVSASPDLWVFDQMVSVGYLALVDFAEVDPMPDRLSERIEWWDVRERPPLLFDHDEIVASALATLRTQLEYRPVGPNLLPEKFTMPELQRLHEAVLGTTLDRRNFQRRMLSLGSVERLGERKRGMPHRAPELYRFRSQRDARPGGRDRGRSLETLEPPDRDPSE